MEHGGQYPHTLTRAHFSQLPVQIVYTEAIRPARPSCCGCLQFSFPPGELIRFCVGCLFSCGLVGCPAVSTVSSTVGRLVRLDRCLPSFNLLRFFIVAPSFSIAAPRTVTLAMSTKGGSPSPSEVSAQAVPTGSENTVRDLQGTKQQPESAVTDQFKLGPREVVILSTLAALNVILALDATVLVPALSVSHICYASLLSLDIEFKATDIQGTVVRRHLQRNFMEPPSRHSGPAPHTSLPMPSSSHFSDLSPTFLAVRPSYCPR